MYPGKRNFCETFFIYFLVSLVCLTTKINFKRENGYKFTFSHQLYVKGFDGFSNGWNGTHITSFIDAVKNTQLSEIESGEQVFWLVENTTSVMNIQYSWKDKGTSNNVYYSNGNGPYFYSGILLMVTLPSEFRKNPTGTDPIAFANIKVDPNANNQANMRQGNISVLLDLGTDD